MAKRDNPRLKEQSIRAGKNKRSSNLNPRPKKSTRTKTEEYVRHENVIIGRNPVMEALKSGREIDKLLVASGEGSIVKIVGMAKDRGVPIIKTERASLDRISAGGAHQGIIAYASAFEYKELEDIMEKAKTSGEEPLIIILDNLEDPHNLGAIMRTAECAGAHGVIIPKRNACGLTETVAKSSAGAIEYVPCLRVTNIVRPIE